MKGMKEKKMAVIKTEHLSHVYSEGTPFVKMAIQDVNLSIEEGELVGVIGHTGSGKSTLIQHLNGLLKPTSGKIYIDGQDMWEDKSKLQDIRFKVGLVFQYPEYQLFEETVYKDIAFGPKNMGLSEEEVSAAQLPLSMLAKICWINLPLSCRVDRSAGSPLPVCWQWTQRC